MRTKPDPGEFADMDLSSAANYPVLNPRTFPSLPFCQCIPRNLSQPVSFPALTPRTRFH